MIKGVNLGGWLVLEKWMKPDLFDGCKALDETTLSIELGDKIYDLLHPHHEAFITEVDFKWIADHGLNLARIPVGHWIFGDKPPFISSIEYLDKAFLWGQKYNVGILIDLHAAKGCQNGFDNGGIAGTKAWDLYAENVDDSLEVIGRLSQRYKDHPALWGIQLLNEPKWDTRNDVLKDYYIRGYDVVRDKTGDDSVLVFHDSFLPALTMGEMGLTMQGAPSWFDASRMADIKIWDGFMADGYKNIMMDTHHYQCHAPYHQFLTMDEHMRLLEDRDKSLAIMNTQFPLMIGEWSLGIGRGATDKMTDIEKNDAFKQYADKQLSIYDKYDAWVFWNYRLGDIREQAIPHWSYRKCVEKGWIPQIV